MTKIIFPIGNLTESSVIMLDAGSQLGSNPSDENAANNADTSSGDQSQAGTQTPAAGEETPPKQGSWLDMLPMILLWGGVFVLIYMFLFRPQRKREKKIAEMQESLKVGDNIVTHGGSFGKIVEIGQDAHVVEFGTNRGVRVPVRKSDIQGIKTPTTTPPPVKESLPVKGEKDTAKEIERTAEIESES